MDGEPDFRPVRPAIRPRVGVIDISDDLPKSLRPWVVLVLDDNVNTMDYVVAVFQRLFGFPYQEATRKMLEVHLQGRSLVARGPKEKCEYDLERLNAAGLTAKIEEA